MFTTEGVKTDNVSKYLNYGINYCKINAINVVKARNTESRKVQFMMEGQPVGKDFQGVDGAKGRVGRVETSYMNTDKSYKDFMRQIGVMADKLGVRPAVDAIKASTIEDYMAQVEPIFKGRYAWWMFGGEEYDEKRWKLNMLKFGFIKSESEIDPLSVVRDGFAMVEVKAHDGSIAMKFDKKNVFHYKEFVKSEDGVAPSAASAVGELFSTEEKPMFEDPFDMPKKNDDLPF